MLSYFCSRKTEKRRRRTPKTRKIDTELLLFIQKDRLLFWLGILTQSVNLVSGVSHTVRYKKYGNQIGELACVLSRSSYPVQPKTASALLGVHNGTLAHLNQILA